MIVSFATLTILALEPLKVSTGAENVMVLATEYALPWLVTVTDVERRL